MPDVVNRMKGLDTATGARPWVCKASTGDCSRGAPCRSCMGRRSKRKGREKQRSAATALRIPASKFASQMGHEENLRGPVRIEVKSGAQISPIEKRFLAYEKQSEAARPVGDSRPFLAVAMPDGWPAGEGIAMFRLSALDDLIGAYTE